MAKIKVETEVDVPEGFLTYDLASGVFRCAECVRPDDNRERKWHPDSRGGSFERACATFVSDHTACVYRAVQAKVQVKAPLLGKAPPAAPEPQPYFHLGGVKHTTNRERLTGAEIKAYSSGAERDYVLYIQGEGDERDEAIKDDNYVLVSGRSFELIPPATSG